ncbi:cyclase [Bacillus wiedmannii]|uniref:cyclase family protein n=1 Tax=Bacillus wiedmannii TaxID=1890302 RepID=UPI000BFC34A6|nr:cyclase family protein [Bacillus wiedmannii]PHC82967.1 cyclase [Bacillus wiedmannii]
MRFIDLSVTIEGIPSEPEPATIEYIDHREGAFILGKSVGLKDVDFPDGLAINLERISLTSHTGTHLDAPYHYGPMSEEKPSKTIEEIPLSWCYGNGVLIDLSKNNIDEPVSKEEVHQYLENINYTLQRNDIVLINTGADKLWGEKEYFTNFRGISLDATEWILEHGIKIIGVDSFGFDPPFYKMLQKYKETGLKQYLWPAHLYGRKKEYCQIERLTNLSSIPKSTGFMVSCFPIKIKNCGAGWSRVVAMIED